MDVVNPDLVLLDLHMPHVDGHQVLEQIVRRAAGSYLPVLVLTADTASDAIHRALAAGARDFVTKPFDATEVVLRVANLLETRALYQRLRENSAQLARELGQVRRHQVDEELTQLAKQVAVQDVLDDPSFHAVFQPVLDLKTHSVRGHEALTRFDGDPYRGPFEWFRDAFDVGLGHALELAAFDQALEAIPQLPGDTFLAINVSPGTVLRPELFDRVGPEVAPRLVLELTEHVPVEDYGTVLRALDRFRSRGARLAVDDTGAGFASLRHILVLQPDIIKLDISLVRGIDVDPARRALAAAMVSFANDTNTALVAEGIETADELDTLKHLGIDWGQGYHLAIPSRLSAAVAERARHSPHPLDVP